MTAQRRTLHDASAIPAELQEAAQWVCWRDETRAGKLTKVPVNPRTGARASSTDSTTWAPFAAALARYEADSSLAGIGFTLSAEDPFVGVDLDHVLGEDGTADATAREFLGALRTYAEASPSGNGLRIIARGALLPDGCRRANVEMYARARFLTVTGHRWPGAPSTIEECTTALARLHAKFVAKPEMPADARVSLDDAALLAKARAARNGGRFCDLYDRGDTSAFASHSEADASLSAMLAFWTGKDARRMDALFRGSALMRAKWDERRGEQTYGAGTMANAVRGCRETYAANGHVAERADGELELPAVRTLRADLAVARRVEWFERLRIPFGAITLFDGPPGCGKTTMLLNIIAAASAGRSFFDQTEREPTTALIVAEEDNSGLLKLRLRAAGANLERVFFVEGTAFGGELDSLTLPRDVDALERCVVDLRASIVYVDAIFSHLELAGEGKMPQQARRALRPIVEMAERTGCAFAAVRHWTKSTGAATSRALGSVELGNVARSTLTFGPNPDNPECFAIATTKSNYGPLAPTLSYRIEVVPTQDDLGKPCDVTRITLLGVVDGITADDLSMRQPADPDERSVAEDWLTDFLSSGDPRASVDVYAEARKQHAGSPATLRRAARKLGIDIRREGFAGKGGSQSTWSLRSHAPLTAPSIPNHEQSDIYSEQSEKGVSRATPLRSAVEYKQSDEQSLSANGKLCSTCKRIDRCYPCSDGRFICPTCKDAA